MLTEINRVLNESFHTYPPHTIQRLAELILRPRQHYKSLPSYLHAVDRVVHVTSPNNTYPLPPAIPDMSSMSLGGPNGVMDQGQQHHENGSDASMAWVSTSNGNAIGSDEALGGALLTPIPWLQRRSAGSRDGDGGSESGESSTLGSDGGPSPMATSQGPAASSQRNPSQQSSSRQFETRTESTETIDGPNGVGSIETVSISVNGIPPMGSAAQQRVITQGELIRQEQRAGVVPVSQLQRSGPVVVTSSEAHAGGDSPDGADSDTTMGEADGAEGEQHRDASSDKSDEEMHDEEEAPHARGPDIIGAADMGPQAPTSSSFSLSSGGNMEVRGIDVEAAVGRKHEAPPALAAAATASASAYDAPDSSDDGAGIMTPASSEEGDAAKDDSDAKPAEQAADKDKNMEDNHYGHGMNETDCAVNLGRSTTPSSTTLSARLSPTPSSKRGAEDEDGAEAAGSSHKRLKEDYGDGESETSNPADKDGTAAQDDATKEKKEGGGEGEGEAKGEDGEDDDEEKADKMKDSSTSRTVGDSAT
jgi:hypothetical protein